MVGVEKELGDGEVVGDGREGDASGRSELGHGLGKLMRVISGMAGNGRSSVG